MFRVNYYIGIDNMLFEFAGVICAISLFVFVIYNFITRTKRRRQSYQKMHSLNADLIGKVTIVTGGNAGIGREICRLLLQRRASVYMAVRCLEKGEQVAADLSLETGNENCRVLELDLANFESIRRFAHQFSTIEKELHFLINNAGIGFCSKQLLTNDGLEMVMQTNYFGPFLLTSLLMELICNTKGQRRIVNVSSRLHYNANIDLMRPPSFQFGKHYSPEQAYCNSKLAQNLFTVALSKRLFAHNGLIACAVHPGQCASKIGRNETGLFRIIRLLTMPLFCSSAAEGAHRVLHVILDPKLDKSQSGKYFEDFLESEPSPQCRDDVLVDALWHLSRILTGLE